MLRPAKVEPVNDPERGVTCDGSSQFSGSLIELGAAVASARISIGGPPFDEREANIRIVDGKKRARIIPSGRVVVGATRSPEKLS
jgi:hypothetical protein